MENLTLFLVKLLVRLYKYYPFRMVYLCSDFLFIYIYYIIRYRRSVVLANLKNSFPHKSNEKIASISQAYYHYLCDLLVEGIKGLTLTKTSLQKRFVYKNPEIFDQYFENNQSVILLGSHYGNWEWGSLTFPLVVRHKVVGIYKPIKNIAIEKYLNSLRKKWGLHLTSMRNTGRAVIENKNQPTIFVLIADQTPSDKKNAHWVDFLNQDTPFLQGADKLARHTGYPVFYFKIKKIKRGYYEVWFEKISLDPKQLKEGEVTQLFASRLEKMIENAPPYWLWSHRRWKRKRPKE